VVSQGFGKFFNLGEGPDGLRITINDIIHACENNHAVATVKIDGSLLIRSVYQNKVTLRTRGSFGYEQCENAHEIEEFKMKYPKLFDPSIYPDSYLLFEWTSPENQIVMRYSEPDITLVGEVTNDFHYSTMLELKKKAGNLNIPLVPFYPLTSQGWNQLYTHLNQEHTIEGYVIRLNNEQDLVKVKSPIYLAKHAFKSRLTAESLIDVWFNAGQQDYQTFSNYLREQYDEEIVMWALPLISGMFDSIREVNGIVTYIKKLLEEQKSWTRKDIAVSMQQKYGQTLKFSIAMALLSGKDVGGLMKKLIRQNMKVINITMFGHKGEEGVDDSEG
jgi:hypothetical protein